jgi:multidrug efflux pump subunit AcrB
MLEDDYIHIFVNLREKAPSNFVEKYINPYLSPKYDSTQMKRTKTAIEIKDEILNALEVLDKDEFDELKIFVPQTGIVKNDIELAFSGDSQKVATTIKTFKEALKNIEGVSNIDDDLLEGNIELKLQPNQYGQNRGIDEAYIVQSLKVSIQKLSMIKV